MIDEIKNCPNCGGDLQGEEIPKEDRHLFGNKTHFSNLIGISDMYADRITHWRCPFCKFEWERK